MDSKTLEALKIIHDNQPFLIVRANNFFQQYQQEYLHLLKNGYIYRSRDNKSIEITSNGIETLERELLRASINKEELESFRWKKHVAQIGFILVVIKIIFYLFGK